MQFAKKLFIGIPNSKTSSKVKDENFEQYKKIREKNQVSVKNVRFITSLDYIQSLSIDPKMTTYIMSQEEMMGSYVYFFDLELTNPVIENSSLKWTIRKRVLDFVTLDIQLNGELLNAGLSNSVLPKFSDFYSLDTTEVSEKFIMATSEYLTKLLQIPEVRAKSKLLYEFLEISLLQLPNGLQKYKEGLLKKKGGGRFKQNKIKHYVEHAFADWKDRWFILTDEGIVYTVDSTSTKSREILLFDQSFQMVYGEASTGSKLGITLITPNRKLHLQAHDIFEALDWISQIQKVVQSSPYTKTNRFMSFAPVRQATHQCKWYVDGESYYSDLYDALLQAKSEVFITDWWLTPELPLKRPVKDGESEYRLDKVLGKIASKGVKIYVIVYREVKVMMYNESDHAKKLLQNMGSNITVLRHPSEPFFNWSHHEKLIVIDQSIGFIGGFDLCFGRWDTCDHPLKDPAMEQGQGETFFGQDYSNPRLADFHNVAAQPHVPLIDKNVTPRMPFHDAMIKVIGPVVSDMARHFIQYYNHVTVDSYNKAEGAPFPRRDSEFVKDEATLRRERVFLKLQSAVRKIFLIRHMGGNMLMPYDDRQISEKNNHKASKNYEPVELKKSHVKKNVQASIQQDLQNARQHNSENKKGISTLLKDPTAYTKLMKGFKDKVISKVEKAFAVHSTSDKVDNEDKLHRQHHLNLEIKNQFEQSNEKNMIQLLFSPMQKQSTIACQMVRSASKWSLGLSLISGSVEHSIQNAYVELIKNAKHFIYIENQFFMSGTAGRAIKNKIAQALLDRIERAHEKKETFRVVVFLPLLPGFEGEIIDPKSAILKIQMHWQYMTISRGGTSIYEQLIKKGIQPIDYIQFYSLRAHDIMPNGKPASEMIYIHSKILVVDDDILLIGSANINDRSLQGSGDSEVAMIFEDSKKVKSYMGGKEVYVSEFVQSFRVRLMSEHLGLSEEEVRDPLTEDFIIKMDEITERNTLIYREVFACYPDDTVRTLKDLEEFEKKKDLSKYAELSPKIQGHVVWFPLYFLCEETLTAPMTTLEYYAPNATFV